MKNTDSRTSFPFPNYTALPTPLVVRATRAIRLGGGHRPIAKGTEMTARDWFDHDYAGQPIAKRYTVIVPTDARDPEFAKRWPFFGTSVEADAVEPVR